MSSRGYTGKTTNSFSNVVSTKTSAEREAMWGEIPGEVVEFDPETQTAKIKPLYKPKHNGEAVDMPELEEVPVRFPRAGGFVLTAPVKAGDKVTLRPQMRNTENYHTDGDGEARDTRSMSLSDMEAFLDGGESLTDPIPGFNSQNLELRSADGQFKLEMAEGGQWALVGATGDLNKMIQEICQQLENLCTQVASIANKLQAEATLTEDYAPEQEGANEIDDSTLSIRERFMDMEVE